MSRLRDAALFVCLALVWGGGFPAAEVGLAAVSPLAALRYYVGAADLLTALVVVRGRDALPTGAGDREAVLVGGSLLTGGNAVLFLGQQFTTGGVASILFGLIPVLTAGGTLVVVASAPPAALGALLFLGVVASVLAYAVYFGLVRRIGAFRVSLVSCLIPAVAAAVGVVALAEPVGPAAVAGVVLVQRERVRRATTSSPP
ncbi:MAG: EamA family transporter [Haloferacaceae archaeon]